MHLPVTRLLMSLVPAMVLAVAPPVIAADGPTTSTPATALAPKVLKPPRGPLADGKARVAQGVMVPHYGSAWRASELAALRPNYADLKPRARTNKE